MLWDHVTRDVRKLRKAAPSPARPVTAAKPERKVDAPQQAPAPPRKAARIRLSTSTGVKPASPPKPAAVGTGISGHVETKLRSGSVTPDAALDLHGMTQEAAHRALDRFLAQAAREKWRCVLVITGKGLKAKAPQPSREDINPTWGRPQPGVLRELVPLWIEHGPQSHLIAALRSASPRHGGTGALYVYLRTKSRVSKAT